LGKNEPNLVAEPDVKDLQDGGMASFQAVFELHFENLCSYACTFLRNMDEAEDVVQNVFLKMWEKRDSLLITHSVRSYLFRAVHHQCLNQLDHRVIRQKHQDHSQREHATDTQPPEVFPEEVETRVKEAIDALPEQCRLIFMMSRYEELRYAAIAEKLGISVNTVENQISKALRVLRGSLKDVIE
jgi:RNA polymerase sigma-70 factor (ECF subfamily)